MSKKSKIIYFILTVFFFILSNFYFSDIILKKGYQIADNPVFDITFIQNQGAAFNLLEGYKLFLIAFSVFALSILAVFVIKNIKRISMLGLFFCSLLMSGIFNNMFERIIFGYVRDFIKLNFIDFPVFNLSDIFINIGVFGIIFIIAKNNYFKKGC